MNQMDKRLFCIRVSAKRDGDFRIIFDRLGTFEEIDGISLELVRKALKLGHGSLEELELFVEALKHYDLMTARLPDLLTFHLSKSREARKNAQKIILDSGVSKVAVDIGVQILTQTYGKGGKSIPGAVILDSFSGKRLDQDENGVCIGRVDLTENLRKDILKKFGDHISRILEWLIVSGKVLISPGLVAELAISQDENNPGGLVSTPEMGVIYFPRIRANENEVGGRILFVRSNNFEIEKIVQHLSKVVLLIDSMGKIR